MNRKEHLESDILDSYKLIREYNEILRLSDDREKKAHARCNIEEQWDFIRDYLTEYVFLLQEDICPGIPKEILDIAHHFPEYAFLTSSGPSMDQTVRTSTNPTLDDSSALSGGPLERLWKCITHYLWGQFLALLIPLIGLLEGIFGIFDVSPFLRRLSLTVLAVLGGGAILLFSFQSRYRSRYQARDRWLTFVLVLIVAGILAWLTCQIWTAVK